ncbi:hypothetical protein ACTFIW_000792 [Dictyostelium discoideum]
MSKFIKMSPFQIVCWFSPPTPVNHFNLLTKTRIPMSNIKNIVRDNILDAQINVQKYYNRGLGNAIFFFVEKVMVKRKFFQTNLSKHQISQKLESMNYGPFIITAIYCNSEDSEWLREEISISEPEVMNEKSYEVESNFNHDKVTKMYLVKLKGYSEPEWIKEVDSNCENLVR